MSPELFAAAVAAGVFAGGLIGLALKRALPEEHTSGPARDMIGAVAGLLTLLCALVTGLLIWTAYGVYAGQNTAIQTLASKVLQLDLALADYGPEANPVRAGLRDRLGKTIDEVWGTHLSDANFAADNFAAAIQGLRDPQKALGRLQPSTDDQRQALATAKSAVESIGQSRLQMSFALSAPVSYPLLLTVVGWVVFLFCGFGLMSKGGAMPVVALAVGAIAVATAVLLILDLSNPYLGEFRASPAPLEQALAVMGKE
ncbi:MAG TPA: hypothetical protein VFE63_01915 [Roseiarcus sp.]|nr:hypothetical protein [Roseiarcus sp.]